MDLIGASPCRREKRSYIGVMGTPAPICTALVVCDDTSIDHAGRHSLIGTFDTLHFHSFPQFCSFRVYFRVTALRAPARFGVTVVDSHEQSVAEAPVPFEIDLDSPVAAHCHDLDVEAVFEAPGEHVVRLWWMTEPGNGEVLMTHRLHVLASPA
jgi:hypothetical protein